MKTEEIIKRIERRHPDGVLLNNEECAAVLQMAPTTLNIWRSKGLGPEYTKINGGSVRYTIESIAEYIVSSTIKTA